jgi:hypothetical protein
MHTCIHACTNNIQTCNFILTWAPDWIDSHTYIRVHIIMHTHMHTHKYKHEIHAYSRITGQLKSKIDAHSCTLMHIHAYGKNQIKVHAKKAHNSNQPTRHQAASFKTRLQQRSNCFQEDTHVPGEPPEARSWVGKCTGPPLRKKTVRLLTSECCSALGALPELTSAAAPCALAYMIVPCQCRVVNARFMSRFLPAILSCMYARFVCAYTTYRCCLLSNTSSR